MQQHIFLSYSRKDTEVMRQLRDYLHAEGLAAWTDEKLVVGTPEWTKQLDSAIRESSAVIALLSPDSAASEWCERELARAEDLNVKIFPILIRGDERAAIPFRLASHQREDARRDAKKAFARLTTAVSQHIGIESVSMRKQREDAELRARLQAEAEERLRAEREAQRRQREIDEAEIRRLKQIREQELLATEEAERQARIKQEAERRAQRAVKNTPIKVIRRGCIVLGVVVVLGALGLVSTLNNQQRRSNTPFIVPTQKTGNTNPNTSANLNVPINCDQSGTRVGPFPSGSTIYLTDDWPAIDALTAETGANALSLQVMVNGRSVGEWNQYRLRATPWSGNLPNYGFASGYAVIWRAPFRLLSPGQFFVSVSWRINYQVFNGWLWYQPQVGSASCTFYAN